MIQAFSPDRYDDPLNVCSLPRRPWSTEHFFDAQRFDLLPEFVSVNPISVSQQVFRCAVEWKGFDQLLCSPGRRRVGGNVKVQDTAAVMGKKFNYVPKDAFEKKMVVAVIKRGNAPVEYTVEQVTTADDKLYVQYKATEKGATTAKSASPLILTVDRGKYTSVVFIENGKQVGTATVGK